MTQHQWDKVIELFESKHNELAVAMCIGQGISVNELTGRCIHKFWLYDAKNKKYRLGNLWINVGRGATTTNFGVPYWTTSDAYMYVVDTFNMRFKFEAIKQMIILFCEEREIKFKIK